MLVITDERITNCKPLNSALRGSRHREKVKVAGRVGREKERERRELDSPECLACLFPFRFPVPQPLPHELTDDVLAPVVNECRRRVSTVDQE